MAHLFSVGWCPAHGSRFSAQISPDINVQAPADATTGYVTVEASSNGVSSGVLEAEIRQVAPALFTYGPAGKAYAAAQFSTDYVTVGDPAVTPGTRAAKPGDNLLLYATGLAPSPAGTIIGTPVALRCRTLTAGRWARIMLSMYSKEVLSRHISGK
jgi:uncharacterized protein (TIGR03437 family)